MLHAAHRGAPRRRLPLPPLPGRLPGHASRPAGERCCCCCCPGQGHMQPGLADQTTHLLPSTGASLHAHTPLSSPSSPAITCPPACQGELEEELAAELASYGLDPAAQRLPGAHYERALSELEARREAAWRGMSPADRGRMDYMRSTAAWHVQRVGLRRGEYLLIAAAVRSTSHPPHTQCTHCCLQMAELASGQRPASPVQPAQLTQAPHGLRPISEQSGEGGGQRRRLPGPLVFPSPACAARPSAGTGSRDAEVPRSPRRGFVEQVRRAL